MSDDIAEAIGADIVIDTDAIDVGYLVAEHRAAIIEIKRLRADLAVAVGALRDMDLAIYADGCHIVNHAEFTADPDHLRRLLTEEQT